MDQEEKMKKLDEAIKQIVVELQLRPISPEYATATLMVFAGILSKWYEVSDKDLGLFMEVGKRLHIDMRNAKELQN
jgi:hypothetical protein